MSSFTPFLFFDIGSTLADETACYKKRAEETTAHSPITPDEFETKAREFASLHLNGERAAAEHFGLALTAWHSELETLYPDAPEVLSLLIRRGYRLGIIANQPPGTLERLRLRGIDSFFEAVFASAEEGLSKPDPELFRRALSFANCPAEYTVMIGDRLDNDILPAKKLGMKTIRILQGPARFAASRCAAEQPDQTISNLSELPAALSILFPERRSTP